MVNEKITPVGYYPTFKDKRGTINNILTKPIKQVSVITTKAGSIRANHYHPKQTQYVYVLSGSYTSYTLNLKRLNFAKVEIKKVMAGDLSVIKPNIAHAMRFGKDTVFLNLVPGTRDSKKKCKDTISYKLI